MPFSVGACGAAIRLAREWAFETAKSFAGEPCSYRMWWDQAF